jgi:ubiquinone/menaquinone biosynthesis C-methylase UbiE
MSNKEFQSNGLQSVNTRYEKIEILPVSLLDTHRELVEELKELAHSLGLDFGWHYLLDLVWIINQLGEVQDKHILDAGAGTGILQWYLAKHNAHVLSVDRGNRADLPLKFRRRFRVDGLRPEDLNSSSQVVLNSLRGKSSLGTKVKNQVRNLTTLADKPLSSGSVTIYHRDLKELKHVPDDSMDAVVAVSALEHNPPNDLEAVVKELLRVLKPGTPLLATLGAASEKDWFHEPSSGWCYTDTTLKNVFQLPENVPSNYEKYDELMMELRECEELRDNLAKFYFQSGNNGMPWGIWDPQYQSVGVCKIKAKQ